ncbi:activating transcription factor 7-interacting protein 1 [Drosophila rhopaloa]|uniref:Fibronectin type-III domain-containing protein n=1 Tax=Drosophila rhopaloa TaxID=1041015 RepID=A0ABM5HYB3_DRORH|nr:activating transcription factor 7-interacting protein 1 [Drosophila rhopaloa]XP_016987156.2 activating transcription factor 7-interacting protein 1 [Drosophila rhopaloa]
MMEVSQNVELKDLSSEGALMRTLSSDLGGEVKPLSTPAIGHESSRTSRDEEDLCELPNGVDTTDTVKDIIDKPVTGSDQGRNAGSDLDALLDKISSIVDCSPRNSDDLEAPDKSEECDSASTKVKTDETEENQAKHREVIEEEEVVESTESEDRVEPVSELETEEKAEVENIEDFEEYAPAKESSEEIKDIAELTKEIIEKQKDAKEKSEEEDVGKAHAADNNKKERAKVNTSSDDVFMDALDSISSSDEFDAFGPQDSEKPKLSKKLNTGDKPVAELEEISSDDEILKVAKVDIVEPAKPKADIIDLDSSDECVVCETTTEELNTIAKIDDTVKVTLNIGAATDKETKKNKISEKPVDTSEDEPVKANEAREPQLEDNPTEDSPSVNEDTKVTEEPPEPIFIGGEEPPLVEVSEESKETELPEEDKNTEKPKVAKDTKELDEVNKSEPEEGKETENLDEIKETEELEEANILKEEEADEGKKEAKETEEIESKETQGSEIPETTKEIEDAVKNKKKEKPEEAQSTEETKETFMIEDEETEDPTKVGKTEVKRQAQTKEINDTSTVDLLMETDQNTLEREEKKVKDDEPMVISENKEPKVNGVCEKSSVDNDKDLVKEKPTSEKEAKETESDDEVIFFEPIDKTIKVDPSESKMSENPKPKDDEVVLVSEDEDEEPQAKKLEKDLLQSTEKEKTAKELPSDSPAESTEAKGLLLDNSDNACDQFEKLKTHVKAKSTATEDGNSNSSNLLRPAEEVEESASKRVRLSTDEKIEPDLETGLEEPQTSSIEKEAKKEIVKRSHDLLGNSPDREEEIPNKKLKTEDSDSNSSVDGTLQIDLDGQDEHMKVKPAGSPKEEDGKELKLELKPEPQIKKDIKPLRLEFFKSFRRSLDTMTRDDLEELVLQKVVEGMLVKSEFADIRLQLDKCENTLATYRRKIAEVSKQFLDLETVHKRVLKDLETKNSHFTAPVRITRAVGLQVGIPFKAIKPTVSAPEQAHSAGSMLAPPSGTPPKASTSPMRSPMRARPPVPGPAFSTGPSSGLGPNPSTTPSPSPQQSRSTANIAQSPAASATPTAPVRRGCLQKVTPQRPGPGNILPVPQVNNQANVHRLQTTSPAAQRTMHASKHTGTTASMAASAATLAAKVAAMRNRNSASAYVSQKQQQYQTPRPSPGSGPGPSPAKQAPKCTTKVRAQQPPLSGATVSVPMSSAGSGSAGSGAYGQQQQPSLAPAKPKEKAVIDLTDEDDAAAAAKAAQAALASQAQIEANARLRQASNAAVKRNAQAAAGTRGGRGGGSVVRASPMQLGRVSARQIVQNNGAGQRSSLGSNVTMQIRSENTPPAASRLRYSHPAPLPTSPAQPFNPAWKVPPSRPVIRISLLDTGIVISWTLEDTSPRFAECVTYQIYAYQETIHEPSTESWRHVGDVNAMLLPMAVTLNQFQENQRYYFAVRGVDNHQRFGPFSVPKTWS